MLILNFSWLVSMLFLLMASTEKKTLVNTQPCGKKTCYSLILDSFPLPFETDWYIFLE